MQWQWLLDFFFEENGKYYPQIFPDECLYEL